MAVLSFLESRNVPYYVHAGYALHLHGLEGGLDDIDIRIVPEREDVLDELGKYFSKRSTMQIDRVFSKGIYSGPCLTIAGKIDICARIAPQVDIGMVPFPFDEDQGICHKRHLARENLPVASLENLLLYYLVLRRGEEDDKKDAQHIRSLLAHKGFSERNFMKLICELPQREAILEIYKEYKALNVAVRIPKCSGQRGLLSP